MVSELEKIIEEGVRVQQDLDAAEDEFNRFRLQKQYHNLEMRAKNFGMTAMQFRDQIRNQAPKIVCLADYRKGFLVLS